ncbi:MAG: ammonium transporter [Alphaproteobacteria bacterium]|nr:ammonium transporter [Alphaproteobacteria bacterium]
MRRGSDVLKLVKKTKLKEEPGFAGSFFVCYWHFRLGSASIQQSFGRGRGFSGGFVVHMTAGFSALVAAILIGKRRDFGQAHKPHGWLHRHCQMEVRISLKYECVMSAFRKTREIDFSHQSAHSRHREKTTPLWWNW